MDREATPFEDMSEEAVAARKALPFGQWGRTYMPHWFQVADAPFHAPLDPRRYAVGVPVCICGARGTAKTTRWNITDTVYDVCNEVFLWSEAVEDEIRRWYAPEHEVMRRGKVAKGVEKGARLIFEVLGAKTAYAAAEKADLARVELKHNKRLHADYGECILPTLGDDEEFDYIANGVRVLCRGTGQSLRSAVYGGRRPQKFKGDDLEDWEIARSAEREEKLRDWLEGGVGGALEGLGQEAVRLNLCNMYGRHCLAEYYRKLAGQLDEWGNPLAEYHVLPLLDEDGVSTWLARYTTRAVKRAMAQMGTARARSEFLCKVANEEAPFRPEWFHTFDVRTLPDFSEVA